MSATPGDDLPGAFPADASAATHEEHHPNKLHKRDDPRGWTDNGSTPRTGAGSGLVSSHNRDASLSAQPEGYTYGSTIAQPSSNTEHEQSSRLDNQQRLHNQGQPTSNEEVGNPTKDSVTTIKPDESSGTAGLASGHGTGATTATSGQTASGENESSTGAGHNTVRNGLGNKSGVENAEPYWGDIPRGAGTYNTVVGHGSAEDSAAGHPEHHREFPLSGGAHSHGTHDHTTAKDSSLTSGAPVAGQGTYNTVVGHGSQEDSTQHSGLPGSTTTATDRENKDSHGKEIAAGAGLAGLGGYAAHKHASKDDDNTADAAGMHSQEEKDHKHGSLLSREHKDHPSHHEKEKHEKDHTPEKTKDNGDKKLFGLFSRSKKDGDEQEHPTATSAGAQPLQSTTATNPTTGAHREDDESHLGRDAGLAGAGLAGAGYAGHKYATRNDEHDDKLRREESPQEKSSSGLHGLFHRKNKDEKEISGSRQDRASTPPNAAEYYNDKRPAEVASALERKGKVEPGESTLYGETSTGHPTSTSGHDNLRNAGAGAAAAAAIPAAAHAGHKHHDEHVQSATTNPTSTERSGHYDTLASGTPSGVASNTYGTAQPTITSERANLSSGTAAGTGTTIPSSTAVHNQPLTGARGGDQYDHLSSGTPSGVSAGLPSSTASHSQPMTSEHSSQPSHLSSAAATGAAAGLLGGAAAHNQSTTGSRGEGDKYDHLASGTPSGVSTGLPSSTATHSQPMTSEYGHQSGHSSSPAAPIGLMSSGTAHNEPTTGTRSGLQDDRLASGTPSGVSTGIPGNIAGHSQPSHPSSAATTGATAGLLSSGAAHDHPTSGAHSGDQYDHLASGTPSGINTGLPSSSNTTHGSTTQSQPATGVRSGDQYDHLASGTPSGIASSTDNNSSHGRDKLAYAGAGAAGAGAAGYGAHKLHEHRDNSSTQPSSMLNPTSSTQRPTDSAASTGAPASAGAAAAAGVGAGSASHVGSGSHGTELGGRSSQDSSKGGMYNVLSSGTPSGVNLADRSTHSPSHSQPQQDLSAGRSGNIHDPLTSSSRGIDQNKMATAAAATAFAGAGAAGYAGTRDKDHHHGSTINDGKSYEDVVARAPERQVASETTHNDMHGTNLMSNTERNIPTSTDQNAGSAAYENKPSSGGVFTGASTGGGIARHMGSSPNTAGGSGSGLSRSVVHTCTECGKDNDISKYFSSEGSANRQ